MKKILLLIAVLVAGCSSDSDCHTCTSKFFDPETREEIYIKSDCNHTPPTKYFVFVGHVPNVK